MANSGNLHALAALCDSIAVGKRLARCLATALRDQPNNEADFRLLWLLSQTSNAADNQGIEQRKIADHLGLSPAQVSALVERVRVKNQIELVPCSHDRRRQFWRLTEAGKNLFRTVCDELANLAFDWMETERGRMRRTRCWEDAA